MANVSNDLSAGMLRRWPVLVVLLMIGAALGVGLGVMREPVYTGEARLSVGKSTLSANMVPGFALATQQIASNYARFVTRDPVVKALNPRVAEDVLTVTGSPVPTSNIIRIEATATTSTAARAAANRAAESLIRQVADVNGASSPKATLARYASLSRQVATMQQEVATAQGEVQRLAATLSDVSAPAEPQPLVDARKTLIVDSARLSSLQIQQNAMGSLYSNQTTAGSVESALYLVNPAGITGDDKSSGIQIRVIAGLAVGGLLALVCSRIPTTGGRSVRRLAGDRRVSRPISIDLGHPAVPIRQRQRQHGFGGHEGFPSQGQDQAGSPEARR